MRNEVIVVKVSKKEKEQIFAAADAGYQNMSDYVRRLVLPDAFKAVR